MNILSSLKRVFLRIFYHLIIIDACNTRAKKQERKKPSIPGQKKAPSGTSATQYVAKVSNIIPLLSFFLSLSTLVQLFQLFRFERHFYGTFFAFVCYFWKSIFIPSFRACFVVIRRSTEVRKCVRQSRTIKTAVAAYGGGKKLENWIKSVAFVGES